jgi:hypothetical protein
MTGVAECSPVSVARKRAIFTGERDLEAEEAA